MKHISISIKVIISGLTLFIITADRSSAQIGVETNVEVQGFSRDVESKIGDFDVNASDIETNESILESQKAIDKDMVGVENSIKSVIATLHFSQMNIDRRERTILWFEILAALDKHLGKITYANISGYIRPPQGYKGKIGIDGMEMPNTNDVADYEYYMAARRTHKRNAMNGIFQNTLHTENDWEATPYAEKYFQSSYTSQADKQVFENLLDHSKLSDARKKALKEAVIGTQQ